MDLARQPRPAHRSAAVVVSGTKEAAWNALPAPVRADLREWLSSPMIDPTRGVTLIQGGVVTWGEGVPGRRAEFLAGPWNLEIREREKKRKRK
jgi:hypothetical protein